MDLTKKEQEARDIIINEVEKVTNLLEEHYEKFCNDTGAKAVPMAYLKASRKIFMDSYMKAAKYEPK